MTRIGYHYVINICGKVETGRHPDETGAHVKGHNSTSIGICLIGKDRFAEAMCTMKCSAILTINDHPEMRKVFKGFRMESVEINYTIGGAGTGKNRRELIFQNR